MCVSYNELSQHMEMDVSLSASIDSSLRLKTNPSADHFQFSCTLYWKHWMRSGDKANIDSCCDSASCTILVCSFSQW